MATLLRNSVLVMFVWLMLAGVCFGKQVIKQVYLSDGSIIDCESFWRHGDRVVVKINRDTVLNFAQNEIDVRKTFRKSVKKARHVKHKKSAGVAPSAGTATAADTGVTAQAPSVPQIPPTPQAPATAPAANPVTSPAPPVAAQETVTPEAAQPVPANPSSAPAKAESERQGQQAAEMMADAIKNKDPELLKKAMEAQKAANPQKIDPPAGIAFTILLVLGALSLLIIVALWVIFTKAGESGWKSLVPIYNLYILLMIAGVPGWWLIMFFIPVVGVVFSLLVMLALAKKFGKGTLFGIGLFLLPILFYPLLAFGGSQYER
jgi:hypothetical protein